MDASRAEIRDTLQRDGFAICRGVFAAAEIAALASATDALLARLRGLAPGEHTVDGALVVIAPSGGVARVVWAAAADPTIDRLSRDPRLLALASLALGGLAFDQLIAQLHPKIAGDEVDFYWHQDSVHRRYGSDEWTDVGGNGSYLQCLVAIDACTAENGPLLLVPGSHRHGPLPHLADRTLGVEALAGRAPQAALLAPGDVAIFGPYVIHGSEPNASGGARRVLVSGFALPGANRRVYPGQGAGRRVELAPPLTDR